MSDLALLAPPGRSQLDALRTTLVDAHEQFPLYREAFAQHSVTPEMARADPLAALARLPLFDAAQVHRLSGEALAQRGHDLGGVELTSGSSGGRLKRRVLSAADTERDAALVTRLLRLAGVRQDDRAVAADLTVESLPLAFLEACERLGVRESVAVAVTPRLDATPVVRLNPTVLIAAPSLLTRIAPALTGPSGPLALRLVIYNGDRLYERTAAAFHARGVGLRSLYGLTETSALGIECEAEQGVHLAADDVLAETRARERDRELVVTTLGVDMPLLRYPTGDLVRLPRGRCACGSSWPRVILRGRIGDRFSLYDQKFSAGEFQSLLLEGPDEFLQIVLSDGADGRERITFRVPEPSRPRRREMRARLRAHPLLDYLLYSRLVRARFRFVDPAAVGRKLPALIDRRNLGRDRDVPL
jgi:phenylacetate-CoA ligase